MRNEFNEGLNLKFVFCELKIVMNYRPFCIAASKYLLQLIFLIYCLFLILASAWLTSNNTQSIHL